MILSPPWTHTGKTIESAIRKALFDFNLIDQQKSLSIALSGGKDSITLLIMLKAILGNGFPKLPLQAIHISGEFSCGASIHTSFLKKICSTLQIPLHIQTATYTSSSPTCYHCSRQRRKQLFETAKELNSPTIAFGHHANDLAETLLMNLLHKGECSSMLPKIHMHHYQSTIIRPLIYVKETMIETFAKQNGYARITCQCPTGQTSQRMKTKKILTHLETIFPNTHSNLASAALHYGSPKALNK